MAELNPVVLIQMLQKYSMYDVYAEKLPRTFVFNRNNRTHTHTETAAELQHRKSHLNEHKVNMLVNSIRGSLKKTLKGRVGKVWIDPEMKKIAVPLQMSSGSSGYGVLPTGSRIKIPEGRFIRAFTYWEKVNDIDLSCFGINRDGYQKEFSWRSMYANQGTDITFSGDQTSGYNGGSEYFDIDIDSFKSNYPDMRYVVFCNNVCSRETFKNCTCFAGFMIRDSDYHKVPVWKGEKNDSEKVTPVLFDPKTVATSFRIDSDSTFAYLFAIDLDNREMVWLNIARADTVHVAGTTSMAFLYKYFDIANAFSVADLYEFAGTPVDDYREADILVCNHEIEGPLRENQEFVSAWDYEKILKVLT